MNNIIVIAPHPDDETLGAGGLILKEKNKGAKIHWIIITSITSDYGWSDDLILKRKKEIELVSKKYNFDSVINLNLPTTRLDTLPILTIVEKLKNEILRIKPDTLIIPHYSDIHTDHQVSFKAAIACTKWFRFPFINRCYAYETISETHWSQNKDFFKPNVFVDITKYIDQKINIMKIYESEIQDSPNPRSVEAIRALATFRGSMSGFSSAESFELLLDRS
jgi:LmbE family N-acetylglucosaminyl deacetylase